MAAKTKAADKRRGVIEKALTEHGPYQGILAKQGLLTAPKSFPRTASEFYIGLYQYMACWLELYGHYQIDLPDDNADFKIAHALATAHVPAFQLKRPAAAANTVPAREPHRPPKLSSQSEIFGFLSELARCRKKLERANRRKPSQRQIILELKRSRLIRDRGISDSTIKSYLGQILRLEKDLREGKQSSFQRALCALAQHLFSDRALDKN